MRPLETLLSLANLLAFLVSAVPLPRAVPWMRHLAPIALAIALAQVLVEGPRWQMVPAYALAGLFFLIWLLQTIAPAGKPAGHRRTNRFAVGLAVGLGVLGSRTEASRKRWRPYSLNSSPRRRTSAPSMVSEAGFSGSTWRKNPR